MVGEPLVLGPELGVDQHREAGGQGRGDGVVGDGLGPQVERHPAPAGGDAVEEGPPEVGPLVQVDSRFGVEPQLHGRDLRAGLQQPAQPGGAVGGQVVLVQTADGGGAVAVGVLRPDPQAEVQPALHGQAGDPLQEGQVLLPGPGVEAGGAHLGVLGDGDEEGVGRGQVGRLVPEGEGKAVEAVQGQQVEVPAPEVERAVPLLVEVGVVGEDAEAAQGALGGLGGRGEAVQEGRGAGARARSLQLRPGGRTPGGRSSARGRPRPAAGRSRGGPPAGAGGGRPAIPAAEAWDAGRGATSGPQRSRSPAAGARASRRRRATIAGRPRRAGTLRPAAAPPALLRAALRRARPARPAPPGARRRPGHRSAGTSTVALRTGTGDVGRRT